MKKNTGKLIVVEGADGSGKGTQVARFVETLRSRRIHVTVLDFPQYDSSVFGGMVGRALKGDFGDFRNMSPYIASLPFTLDRLSAKDGILGALKKGIVICNRYTPSNVAYQAAKLSGKERESFVDFLEYAEYVELGLPKPDLVMYLHVPPKISYALVANKDVRQYLGTKKGARDQHESDRSYQDAVVKTYLKLARDKSDWHVIKCAPYGKLLSRDEIHALVMKVYDSHASVR